MLFSWPLLGRIFWQHTVFCPNKQRSFEPFMCFKHNNIWKSDAYLASSSLAILSGHSFDAIKFGLYVCPWRIFFFFEIEERCAVLNKCLLFKDKSIETNKAKQQQQKPDNCIRFDAIRRAFDDNNEHVWREIAFTSFSMSEVIRCSVYGIFWL